MRIRPPRLSLALAITFIAASCSVEEESPAEGAGSDDAAPQTSDATAGSQTSGDPSADGDSSSGAASIPTDGSDDGASETGEPVATPVFAAVGDGGWFATSCDAGRTWRSEAFSKDVKDHSPWSAFGGLASGNGAFVAGFGWGPPGTLMRSTDGASWVNLPDDAFTGQRKNGYNSWTAAVVFDGAQFLVFAHRRWASTDGATWTEVDATFPAGVDQLRQGRAFADGQIVLAVESQSGRGHAVGNFIIVSEDGGETWTEGGGYDSQCGAGVQHFGDIAQSGDALVVASDAMCRSTDRGLTWESVMLPDIAGIDDVFTDDRGFGFVAQRNLWRSEDGATWSQVSTISPDQDIAEVAFADGTYVAVHARGAHFYYSDDGSTWAEGALARSTEIMPVVRDLGVLYVDALCADTR